MATPAALTDPVFVRHAPSDRDGVTSRDALELLSAQLGLGAGLEGDGLAGVTRWCVRLTLPGIAPADAIIVATAVAAGLAVEGLRAASPNQSRWLLIGPQSRAAVAAAVAHLRRAHRIQAVPFRRLTEIAQEHP